MLTPTPSEDLRRKLLEMPALSEADRATLNELFSQQRRYGLVWEDKIEDVEEHLREYLPVLEEVAARHLVAADPAAPAHALIEGDNLHALTVLNYTHAGQVDVIYIDPPYNTGNRDFMYNDTYVDREDGYRHSKWLSFMGKRLDLAKTLLKETGVIYISIDDNEQAQLKLLCDSVFGEENFVANIIWQKNYSPKSTAKHFSVDQDYIFIYAKNGEIWRPNLMPRSSKQDKAYRNPDNDERGPWKPGDLSARNYYSKGTYPITSPSGRLISGPPQGTYWRYSEEKFKELDADNRIWWGKDGNNVPAVKRFLESVKQGVVPQTMWFYSEVGHTQDAKKEVVSLLGGGEEEIFSTPKPLKLMQRILELSTNKSALILDFFAGSGTTLQATMALNAEDGGSRRCILVTNNENGICEQVTYERNRRVIHGYTTPKGVSVAGLTDNSLRYYRCVADVPRLPTLRHKRELVRRATELLCLKENCYAELPGSGGPKGVFRAFGSERGTVVVVFDEDAVEDAVAYVAGLPVPSGAVAGWAWCAVYVFAPGSYAYEEEFADVADRARVCALPEALYRAWQELLPAAGKAQKVAASPTPVVKKEGGPAGLEIGAAEAAVSEATERPRRTGRGKAASADDAGGEQQTKRVDKHGNPMLF